MGIPSYFSYVLRNHTKIIKRLQTVKLHTLLIDANSFIYDVVYETPGLSNQEIYENVYKKIKDLVNKLKVNSVFVAFDGTAPLAKMKQQKQRRYKSWITKKILNQTSTWNTNVITPGTKFMKGLDEFLKPRFETDGYMFSGSGEQGEGEHKLFEYLRKRNNPKHSTVVYGLDADLIMLSLLHVSKFSKLYLYRETRHFSYMSGIDEKSDYVFNVEEMANQISENLYGDSKHVQKAVENYCLLCFLCGNDFLPHFPSINIRNGGIEYLLEIFKKHIQKNDLATGTKIHWKVMKDLFLILSEQEQELIKKNIEWKKNLKVYSKNKDDELNHLPMRECSEEYLVEHYDKYYPFLFGQQDCKPICQNYLKMFEWTWFYYHGLCKSNYLAYDFQHAPLFTSLLNNIPCFGEEFVSTDPTPPVDQMTQLAYVLPYADYTGILPSNLIQEIETKFPQLCKHNFPVDYKFCKFFWESHVDFNYINIKDLDKLVKMN
jgi:5'-3' exoribonuclease 1